MSKVLKPKTVTTKAEKARPQLDKEHPFEITHNHGLSDSIREEEQRVATTCFRCHGPKPKGGGWYCPKCRKIADAAIAAQLVRFSGG